ncbi:MAG: peptide chain release factor N(5)-glutamine methyltransferase [Patescibacteria group bacterium]|jgi:release factor glutamine methyltransferase
MSRIKNNNNTRNEIKKTLVLVTRSLKSAKITTALLDAEVLLAFVLKKPKEFLYTHPEYKLNKQQLAQLKQMVNRRGKGEPVAYLRNTKEFYDLDFYVDKRVLIPRPETEVLVEEVLKQFRVQSSEFRAIADIGTGSGCIAITLAKHLPKAKILATDISKLALDVARKNAKKHQAKIKFYHGDLLEPLKNKRIDIIVANLPYLDNYYKSSKNPGLKFEPKTALEGYQQGLAVYEKLFKQIAGLKHKPKIIICEIGPTQAEKMKRLTKKYLPKSKTETKKDLAGLNRLLITKI